MTVRSYKPTCAKQCTTKISCNNYKGVMDITFCQHFQNRFTCCSLGLSIITESLHFIVLSYYKSETVMPCIPILFLSFLYYF